MPSSRRRGAAQPAESLRAGPLKTVSARASARPSTGAPAATVQALAPEAKTDRGARPNSISCGRAMAPQPGWSASAASTITDFALLRAATATSTSASGAEASTPVVTRRRLPLARQRPPASRVPGVRPLMRGEARFLHQATTSARSALRAARQPALAREPAPVAGPEKQAVSPELLQQTRTRSEERPSLLEPPTN